MSYRKCNELLDPVVEMKIRADEQRADSCLYEVHEGGVDFAVGFRLQSVNL